MRHGLIYFFCALVIFVVSAFQLKDNKPDAEIKDSTTVEKQEVPISALVQTELKERLDAFKKEAMIECKASILSEAETYVDSIISVQLNHPLIDTTQAPPKPDRPIRPYDTLILDSFDIDPLLNDSLLMDTLQINSLSLDSIQ